MKKTVKYIIIFGKDRYHQLLEMCNWCMNNVGHEGWLSGTPTTWQGLENFGWCVDCTFGNTTFAFKDPKHFSMFVLRWS